MPSCEGGSVITVRVRALLDPIFLFVCNLFVHNSTKAFGFAILFYLEMTEERENLNTPWVPIHQCHIFFYYFRHRMAQYASRASVNLHTHIFFRNKKSEEDGYVLFIRQNAIQVLIPKYGLEGTLYIKNDSGFVFDEDTPCQTHGSIKLTLFQKLKIQLSLDQSNVQHEKLEVRLIDPYIPGFSVEKEGHVKENVDEKSPKPSDKRKSEEESGSTKKSKKAEKKKWRKM